MNHPPPPFVKLRRSLAIEKGSRRKNFSPLFQWHSEGDKQIIKGGFFGSFLGRQKNEQAHAAKHHSSKPFTQNPT
ncbi:MAG: hypothetical protein Q9N02_02730 [Ghiorsea sp.]|nr:hypothetical protein [Ghiorsea sp.]